MVDRSDDENSDSDGGANDAEGVWSPDIETAFREALETYPPCGRRKIILSEEGKMYGRNELIARYIKIRTGKTRTRKQVSSHIQVLARKKSREIQSKFKDHSNKEKAMQVMSTMSSAQIVSAAMFSNKPQLPTLGNGAYATSPMWQNPMSQNIAPYGHIADIKPCINGVFGDKSTSVLSGSGFSHNNGSVLPFDGRFPIASHKLRLLDFNAYVSSRDDSDAKHFFTSIAASQLEPDPIDISVIQDKFPENKGGLKEHFDRCPANAFFMVKVWADMNCPGISPNCTYEYSSTIESLLNIPLEHTTRVCSSGKQVIVKVESEQGVPEGGRYIFRRKSTMCEYMINFIIKLQHLSDTAPKADANTLLENFTVLQIVSNQETQETLLCIAFMFEVSSGHGNQHKIYRLQKDSS
ncbi:hypothetical protein RvY_17632 [Ramazzottius varieornatus]|uniref:TEA domain-containing protein n=1 Tax=Ramazzottius varieornatus TaxID=947166 RepID=A0A1D1W2U3_RAMVA|nr:hypothetical protein RvY_17632 [Ramazzottius varieornatus]